MARILAYTSPAIGHLFHMTPLLLELRARGHDVHLRTAASRVELMRDLGSHTDAIDPAIPAMIHPDWEASNPKQALEVAISTILRARRDRRSRLPEALDEVAPDTVLVDINARGALNAGEAWGGPWTVFSPYTPPISSAGEYFRRTPLMLVTTSEPFEYPHDDWGDRIRMIGALPWDPPAERPPWLDDVDRPIVLVTTSSEYQADWAHGEAGEALVRAALDGLRDEPYTVVATMPAGVQGLGDLPANARVLDFVPHRHVLDRTAVAVTHGGMGATQKPLARGIPVCVVPFGRDQLEVARRVEVCGAGSRLPGFSWPRSAGAADVGEARPAGVGVVAPHAAPQHGAALR